MGFCTFVGAEWCGSSEAHDTALVATLEPPWYTARPPSWCSRSRGRGRADSPASNLTAVIIDVAAAAEPRKLDGGSSVRCVARGVDWASTLATAHANFVRETSEVFFQTLSTQLKS